MYQRNVNAQFGIEKKRTRNGAISELLIHRQESDRSLTRLGWYTRQAIVDHIEAGNTYMTVRIDHASNTWYPGEDVHVVTTRDGSKYLRTDRNAVPGDNLGNLPEG